MSAPFVHLRLHTEYSLVDGLIRIKSLVKQVAAAGMPAVAVTDMSNLFALIKFYKAALGAGIKPIVGVEVWVRRGDDPARLVLLCQDLTGYRHLTRLVSRGYLEGQQRGVPAIDFRWLAGNTAGLIALSGGREGELGQALLNDRAEQARNWLAEWRQLFPERFYLELQRTGRPQEEEYLEAVLDLAAATGTPVVATNEVCFLQRGDFEAHETRVCIHEGVTLDDPRRPRRHSDQQYLRSPAEMAELFADVPEALENSVEIARRCNLQLELGKNVLPDFPIPADTNIGDFFSAQARAGLEQRLRRWFDPDASDFAERRQPYDQRLEIELKVIIQMGFPGYFLIVADFIQWARANEVPVGPGRGSGAGSLVAYALGITDLDPLAYDLLFERFLNPERVSMPDFDIDFCMEGRDRVIEYVAQRYGRDRVSQIATHGTMAAKAVVRDVGRVLGHPYGYVDRIAKLIPFEIGMTLDKAIEQEAELRRLYENDEEVRALIDLARKLEGLARNVGKHAGGVVIAPSTLTDFSPLYCEEGDAGAVTQFDKDDVESAGLVKFDFLGLRTLTIIDWAVRTINRERAATGESPLDISTIPLDDALAFDLLKRHQTTAVFQLESSGMKDLIRRLQPDCFEDIVALVALFRPGPLQSGMVDDFIDRKHGRARIEYPHPTLATILQPTYGVILYQEQVMQIAQVLAGYTLGGADLLRRAMGKKKPEEMAKQRETFVKGSVEHRVDSETASYIFDLMEKFAGYGFNKCVHGDTVVMDAHTGEETRVEALFRNPREFFVHALDDAGKLQIRRVSDVVWNGRKPVFELTTALGKRITTTANHPFRTLEGWTPLENLRVGDRIAAVERIAPHIVGRESQLAALRRRLASVRTGMTSKDTIPTAVRAWVAAERTRLGLTWKALEQGSGVCMKEFQGLGSPAKRGFRRTTMARLARFLGSRRLGDLADSDLFWDRVVSIESRGIADTYDLTVEEDHNFVANGLVVHNSHSAAYALVSYQTAWLKAHYPAAFMAAVLSSDMDKTDKVVVFIEECRRMGLKLAPPAINASEYRFTVGATGEILYGLGAIKGAGEGAIEALWRERERSGPFRDLFDLCQRVDLRKLNRRVLEALVRSGAFDALGANRATLMAQLPEALRLAEQHSRNDAAGQNDMFGLATTEEAPARPSYGAVPESEDQPAVQPGCMTMPPAGCSGNHVQREWDEEERLRGEKETLGVYLTGHPINRLKSELEALGATRLRGLNENGGGSRRGNERALTVAGLVVSLRTRNANRGGRIAFVTLDDGDERMELRIFPEVYEQHRSLIVEDAILLVRGSLGWDEFNQTTRLNVERVLDLDGARAERARRLQLRLNARQCAAGVLRELAGALAEHRADGRCAVWVEYVGSGARVELAFGSDWRVKPCEVLLRRLRELAGAEAVRLRYDPQPLTDRNAS